MVSILRRPLPPVLLSLALALMWAAANVLPLAPLPVWLGRALGVPLVVAGVLVAAIGRAQFARARTNIHTFRDPDVLVTDGLFGLTRNPMYLGFAMVALGAAVLLAALSAVVTAAAFVMVTDRWYIRHEEQALRRVFGERYERYAAGTRRWL